MNPLSKDVIDREIALQRLGGKEKLLTTLAQFFLEDAPGLMQQLEAATQSGDCDTIAIRAHSLKGLSSTFEAVPFQELAAEVESFARAGDKDHVQQSIPKLNSEFTRLVDALKQLAE